MKNVLKTSLVLISALAINVAIGQDKSRTAPTPKETKEVKVAPAPVNKTPGAVETPAKKRSSTTAAPASNNKATPATPATPAKKEAAASDNKATPATKAAPARKPAPVRKAAPAKDEVKQSKGSERTTINDEGLPAKSKTTPK